LLKHLKWSAVFSAILTVGALTVSAQAFTAGSAVAATQGGAGSDVITGYVVTDVDYSFSHGTTISGVTFKLDSEANSARVAFGDGSLWNACSVAAAADLNGKYAVTCQGLNVPVAAADSLSVVAQNS
jgi:hypothetical protein